MKGEAKNFSAVALQSDVFAESKELKNPVISDIDLTLAAASRSTLSRKWTRTPSFTGIPLGVGAARIMKKIIEFYEYNSANIFDFSRSRNFLRIRQSELSRR